MSSSNSSGLDSLLEMPEKWNKDGLDISIFCRIFADETNFYFISVQITLICPICGIHRIFKISPCRVQSRTLSKYYCIFFLQDRNVQNIKCRGSLFEPLFQFSLIYICLTFNVTQPNSEELSWYFYKCLNIFLIFYHSSNLLTSYLITHTLHWSQMRKFRFSLNKLLPNNQLIEFLFALS